MFQAAEPNALTGELAPEEQGAKWQNRLRLVPNEQANEFAQRLKERLADPEQRVALRAEQRAAVVSQNVGVGRLVGLDPAMEQKLIELLTDQQMERLEQMHVQPRPNLADLQAYADEMTQRMNALRDLLGDEKLERFQTFEMNRSGRYWVGRLSSRLAPADRLQLPPAMRVSGHLRQESPGQRPIDRDVQEQDNMRRLVESARAEAGLDPKIPEQPEVAVGTPQLIEAQVQIEVSLTVNREPTTVTRTVRNGESFTFEAAQGLIAGATPMMYDDDWIDVHLKYYEEGTTGRRRLSGGSISTVQVRQSDGSLATGGSSGTVISGRKGYAVETTVNAKVL